MLFFFLPTLLVRCSYSSAYGTRKVLEGYSSTDHKYNKTLAAFAAVHHVHTVCAAAAFALLCFARSGVRAIIILLFFACVLCVRLARAGVRRRICLRGSHMQQMCGRGVWVDTETHTTDCALAQN